MHTDEVTTASRNDGNTVLCAVLENKGMTKRKEVVREERV